MLASLQIPALLAAASFLSEAPADIESNLQRALAGIYDSRDADALQALDAIEAARPGYPAAPVYRTLLAYWRAAADPGNPDLTGKFRGISDTAIRVSEAWTVAHPSDPEGWRYLASALGQRSQFAVSVAPNKGDIVRYGLKARDAVIKAQSMDPSDKDILIGLGAANYFAANIPWFLRPVAFALGVRGGDRELGLRQIREGMDKGPHSAVEGAMVLAGAMYTEENYAEFYKIISERVLSTHPSLLPAASWAVSGCICGGLNAEAAAAIRKAVADDAWRNWQLGRIALARGAPQEARDCFTKTIEARGNNRTILSWAYYGRSIARSKTNQPDGGDMKHAKEVSPTAFDLAKHQFQTPGKCAP